MFVDHSKEDEFFIEYEIIGKNKEKDWTLIKGIDLSLIHI